VKKTLCLAIAIAGATPSWRPTSRSKAKAATVCAAATRQWRQRQRFDPEPRCAAGGFTSRPAEALKDGTRKNPVMNAIAAPVERRGDANVAAWSPRSPALRPGWKSAFLPAWPPAA